MSIYTEAEHAIALTDTVRWIDSPPATPEERYLYGLYQFRLKDYNEAFHWFSLAACDGVDEAWFDLGECLSKRLTDHSVTLPDLCRLPVPDSEIPGEYCYRKAWEHYSGNFEDSEHMYRKAYLLSHGFGTVSDPATAAQLFQSVIDMHPDLTPEHFDICCNYSTEGSTVTAPTELFKLPVGNAFFELALNRLPALSSSLTQANPSEVSSLRQLLRKAYDFHCEEALFTDFALFGTNYENYEYQDEIRELYSFRIGQYVRVCDVNPSEKAYLRLIGMYENGYPGDEGERKKAFAMKAVPLRKKMEALAETSKPL